MFPSLSIDIFAPAGFLPSPGISIILPAIATKNSAPDLISISLMVLLNPVGAFNNFPSSLSEYWVFAITIGSLDNLHLFISLIFSPVVLPLLFYFLKIVFHNDIVFNGMSKHFS